MKAKPIHFLINALPALAAMTLLESTSVAVADHDDSGDKMATGLVREVIKGTRQYRDASAAMAAGWFSNQSCVSGPEKGAMGIHFSNVGLLGDAVLDPRQPEALIYELKNNRLRLVGVEFIVFKSLWEAENGTGPLTTPSLLGQRFHFIDAPNRYGLEPLYELHVWAWRNNPYGMFVDWNPKVSCDEFVPDPAS